MSFSLLEFRAWRYCNDAAVCFSKIRSGTTRLRLVLPLEFRIFEVFSSVEEVKQVTVFVYYMYPHFQSESWISFLSFENDFSFTPK